jgi:ketosteroid isomerase-like protein
MFVLLVIPRFAAAQAHDPDSLRRVVAGVENAFAKTMADRNLNAFAAFVSDEAIFLGAGNPLRGKQAVVEHWKKFFADENVSFSWKAEFIEVLPSGSLAVSDGPVFDPNGKLIGRFYSTWRREPDGKWRIVFDNGYDVCEPVKH